MTENPVDSIKPELTNTFEVKRATEADLPKVWGIIDKCAKWMKEKGINHWADWYTEEMMSKLINKKEVYLGSANGELVATMTFDSNPPDYYINDGYLEKYTNSEEPAGYIMAIGVLPVKQKQGHAVRLLDFAENEANSRKIKWLRLDCRAEDIGLAEFYERRGFVKVGDTPVVEGTNETYWLMEKKLQ